MKEKNIIKQKGISLIVLVITIIVIVILASAIILSINNNNPIKEANLARYESDVANMQAIFTNSVAKVMAQNKGVVSVTPGEIDSATGVVNYTVDNAMDINNTHGTIVFGTGTNSAKEFFTGKALPVYAAGETKWYVDSEGNISLEVAGVKYGNGEIKKAAEVTLIKGSQFKELVPDTIKSIEFLKTAAPERGDFKDVSQTQDGSILAWIDGTKFYVAPKNTRDIICANQDSSNMFNFGVDTGDDFQPGIYFESIKFDNFNTSNVVNMSYMFQAIAGENNSFMDLSNWDMSKVENMDSMFKYAHIAENSYNIENWDVSNVKNMNEMFYFARFKTTIDNECDLSNWNVSNVTSMHEIFSHSKSDNNSLNLNLSNWNLSKVTNLSYLFEGIGGYNNEIKLNLINWNVAGVNDMSSMFQHATVNENSDFIILGLNTWDVSNVTDMSNMFYYAGLNTTATWNIGDISSWNTSNVTDMTSMFNSAGNNADYILDLSSWDISNVTNYSYFKSSVEDKIISPWD